MSEAAMTREDLRDTEGRLTEQMRDGFAGVHERLDRLNGRVRKGETVEVEHAVKIQTLEREMREVRTSAAGAGRRLFGDLKVLVLLAIGIVTGTITVLSFLGKIQ